MVPVTLPLPTISKKGGATVCLVGALVAIQARGAFAHDEQVVGIQPCKAFTEGVLNESYKANYWGGNGWYGGATKFIGGPKDGNPKFDFGANPTQPSRSNFDMRDGACVPADQSVQAIQSKGKANSNEALTCNNLLQQRDKLLKGGYNCFGRHERTYWTQYYGEEFCKKKGNCAGDGDVYVKKPTVFSPVTKGPTQSRYLSDWGWKASKCSAKAFANVGLAAAEKVDTYASSKFPRCYDGMAHFAAQTGKNVELNVAGMTEPLMYTGSLPENLGRKGICGLEDALSNSDTEGTYQLAFDQLRKMAGTPPKNGTNNWSITHGFNMKGAFGNQIDEGHWMCLKPLDEDYPMSGDSGSGNTHTWDVGCGNATVSFDGVKQFGVDFLLTSESFELMESCAARQSEVDAAMEGSIQKLAGDDLMLTLDEAGPYDYWLGYMLLRHAQDEFVAATQATIRDPDHVHLGLFSHLNLGYRYVETLHTPLRYIVEDTISFQGVVNGSSPGMLNAMDFILRQAKVSGLHSCDAAAAGQAAFDAISTCHESIKKGPACYWGGKEKATVNVDADYAWAVSGGDHYNQNGKQWFGNPTWFPTTPTSPYVTILSCMVDKQDDVSLEDVLAVLGCPAPPTVSCPSVPAAPPTISSIVSEAWWYWSDAWWDWRDGANAVNDYIRASNLRAQIQANAAGVWGNSGRIDALEVDSE